MLLNNRYRVIKTLGSGGFGETFLAEDTQMPSRRYCVIKQLKPITHNPQIYKVVQERFQREAAILEELGDASSQIPRLYAYFLENGQFYLVQEYIEGQTLSQKLEQGAMSESAVRDILVSILPVLDYVHRKGIVHRDIKPDNIIVRNSDGKPVLIDFGAVKETIGTDVSPSGNSTRSIVIGTPGFMPSEQSVGRPMFASDIYSLGMTAIYLLTAKLPQDIPSDPATGAILWQQYVRNITPHFVAVLDRAVQFVARDRFATASEMLVTLQTGAFPTTPTVPYSYPPTSNPTSNPTQQNTIPISPGNYQQPSNPGNTANYQQPVIRQSSNKGILMGGLIAAGLVAAAVAIGVGMRSQQVAEEPNPETTISTRPTQTQTPLEPQEENTEPPIQPKPRRTSINSRPRPTPIETQEPILPVRTQTPIAEIPIPIATPDNPQPIETPIAPITPDKIPVPIQTPTQTPSPITPIETPKPTTQPSPENFVQNYYETINNGDLPSAWNKLAPSFRDNRKLHPKGYTSYTQWWGGQVEQVDINQVRVVQANQNTATVDAQLNYELKNGSQSPASVRFILIWDANSNQWVISDAQRLRG
jgi:serine/threonine protein kinase, bacterial